jgi:hypothetical protein
LIAKRLQTKGLSYRKIAAEFAALGLLTGGGKPHAASAIQKVLGATAMRRHVKNLDLGVGEASHMSRGGGEMPASMGRRCLCPNASIGAPL